jgi:hypothetical protein
MFGQIVFLQSSLNIGDGKEGRLFKNSPSRERSEGEKAEK